MDGSARRDSDAERTPEPSPPPGKANWPRISDYWPDNPRRRGPMRGDQPGANRRRAGLDDQTLAYNQIYPASDDMDLGAPPHSGVGGVPAYGSGIEEPAPTRLISPPPAPRRPRLRLAVTAAGTAVFLGLGGAVLVRLVSTDSDEVAAPASPGGPVAAGEPSPPVPISPLPSAEPSASASAEPTTRPSASPSAGAPTSPGAAGPAFPAGTFVLADSVTEVNLTLGRPAGGAVRASTPAGSGLTTRAATAGTTVTVTTKPTGKPGSGRIDVLLDVRIAWTIRMAGGVRKGTFALAGGTVRAVDLAGGADTIDLALPRSAEALPIRMSGGVHTWRIHTEREQPVRVKVREGAGEVTLYGKGGIGVDKGKQVSTGSGAGLEIDAVAGVGSLTVSAG